LLITGGGQQSLDLLARAFLRPGDAVALENPGYTGAISIFNDGRVRCLGVPVRSGLGENEAPGLDIGALEATLSANRVKLIILTPDFHNPTGTTMPLEARRRLLEVAARHQAPVVEDHVYARLHGHERQLPSLKQLDRSNLVIQIDSFSKMAFPGLRVGWIVAPASVIERLRTVKQATDLHSDQLAQAALAEFTRGTSRACAAFTPIAWRSCSKRSRATCRAKRAGPLRAAACACGSSCPPASMPANC
jgi:2-aminoadipate transaminase